MFGFLSPNDRSRLDTTFEKLRTHNVSNWVLTGGLALEHQLLRRGGPAVDRPLNDIDFVVSVFDDIPLSLGENFLFRHVHPNDPPAKTLLQAIDGETALRTDVFRAYGDVISRSEPSDSGFRVVSLGDLVARLGRLVWDIVEGHELPRKYASDFIRGIDFVTREELEICWRDHRKPVMAENAAESIRILKDNIARRPDLLVTPNRYSTTPEMCSRCHPVSGLPLAPPERIVEILGYC